MRQILALILTLVIVPLCYGYDESWDFASPSGTTDAGTLDTEITDLKKAIAERLNNDHYFDETNNDLNDLTCGNHRQVTMLEKSAAPTHAANTGILYTIDDGGDTELGYTDDGGSDIQITKDGFVNVPTTLNVTDVTVTNDLTVDNDIHVTSIVGTLAIAGNTTVTGTFSSTSDTTVGGHLYADDISGDWVSGLSATTLYQADTDGFVIGWFEGNANGPAYFAAYTDDTDASTMRLRGGVESGGDTGNDMNSFCLFVKKGDYYKVLLTGGSATSTIFWIPID